MTNYNERLDEIFAPLIDSPSLTLTTAYWDEAKQALTSLIKELVAEARIDELSQLLDEGEGGYPDGCEAVHLHSIEDRIAQLTQSNKEQPND